MNFFVIERHDDAKRLDDLSCFGIAGGSLIEERLINVRLNDREFHARLVAQALDVFSRARGRQNLEIDVGLRPDERRDVASDLDVSAARRRRHDLEFGGGQHDRRGERARRNDEDRQQSSLHHFTCASGRRMQSPSAATSSVHERSLSCSTTNASLRRSRTGACTASAPASRNAESFGATAGRRSSARATGEGAGASDGGSTLGSGAATAVLRILPWVADGVDSSKDAVAPTATPTDFAPVVCGAFTLGTLGAVSTVACCCPDVFCGGRLRKPK